MRTFDSEEAGILQIAYSGEPLDMFAVGVLNLQLQYIFDKSAAGALDRMDPDAFEKWYLQRRGSYGWSTLRYEPLVRTEIRELHVGSLYQSVALGLTSAMAITMAHQDIRSIIQGLAANAIWAIGNSGVKGLLHKGKVPDPPHYPLPFEVGRNVASILRAVSMNGSPGSEFTIRHKSPHGGETEITYRVPGEKNEHRR